MLRNMIIIALVTYAIVSGVWLSIERDRIDDVFENQRAAYAMLADNLRAGMAMRAEIADMREQMEKINIIWGPSDRFETKKSKP